MLKPGDRPNNGITKYNKNKKNKQKSYFQAESPNLVTDLMITMVLTNIQNKQKSYFHAKKLRPGDRPNDGITKYNRNNEKNKQKSYFQEEKPKPGDRPNNGINKYTK